MNYIATRVTKYACGIPSGNLEFLLLKFDPLFVLKTSKFVHKIGIFKPTLLKHESRSLSENTKPIVMQI